MTIPFGSLPGLGPASISPPVPLPALVPIAPARGRLYAGQDWQLNVVGGDRAATPDEIDEAMALSFSVPQGSFRADPTLGNSIGQIKYLGGPKFHSDIVNRVNAANPCARLIASGDVRVTNVTEQIKDGRLYVFIDYEKPKLGGTRKQAAYRPGGAPMSGGVTGGATQNDGNTLTTSNGEGVWL